MSLKYPPLPAGIASHRPPPSRREGRLTNNVNTATTLTRRELIRMFRTPTRVIGIISQPLIFWFILGTGFSSTFSAGGMDYATYFFPGILALVLLFTAIFSTITLIEDKEAGLLQSFLAGPGSRTSIVVGKVAGVAIIALLQMALMLLILPLSGIGVGSINWFSLFATSLIGAWGLGALGFFFAWGTGSSAAYHALMSMVLIPMWILSGAVFPLHARWMEVIAAINPMAWLVTSMRISFIGHWDAIHLAWMFGFAIVMTAICTQVAKKKI